MLQFAEKINKMISYYSTNKIITPPIKYANNSGFILGSIKDNFMKLPNGNEKQIRRRYCLKESQIFIVFMVLLDTFLSVKKIF